MLQDLSQPRGDSLIKAIVHSCLFPLPADLILPRCFNYSVYNPFETFVNENQSGSLIAIKRESHLSAEGSPRFVASAAPRGCNSSVAVQFRAVTHYILHGASSGRGTYAFFISRRRSPRTLFNSRRLVRDRDSLSRGVFAISSATTTTLPRRLLFFKSAIVDREGAHGRTCGSC